MSPTPRLPIRLSVALGLLLVVTAVASSCTQDFDQFFSGPANTGASGGSGGTGGGDGGSGGGDECAEPEDCPGLDTSCAYRRCTAGRCGMEIAPAATPCTENGGQVCDGSGQCVECSTADQCEDDEQCQGNQCVPLACSDGVQNGSETAIDCGGDECAPCALGEGCLIYTDCETWFCDLSGAGGAGGAGAAGVCAACGNDNDCTAAPTAWCDSNNQGGTCTPQKQDGDICSGANECLSGNCPGQDGVCCDAPCTVTCRACLQGKTGSANGTCDYVTVATDPDGECGAAQPSTCDSDGTGCTGSSTSCILYDNATVCAVQSCTGWSLVAERECDGGGDCEPGSLSSCAPYMCNAGGTDCRSTCTDDAHCTSGNYCDGSSCVAVKPNGDPCGGPGECQSGFCPPDDAVCCDVACDGQCVACLGSKTGGSNGTCDVVSANTDPDTECTDTGGPCGPDGSGCNGSSSDPDCQGYTCDCDEQYTHGNIHELCAQNANECELRASAAGASCDQICAAGGGECLNAVNDNPDGTCNHGTDYGCGTTGFSSVICICSRGCDGDAACESPWQCVAGDCE